MLMPLALARSLPRQGFTYFCLAFYFAPFTYLKFCNNISNHLSNKYGTAIFAPAPRGFNDGRPFVALCPFMQVPLALARY